MATIGELARARVIKGSGRKTRRNPKRGAAAVKTKKRLEQENRVNRRTRTR